jgi:hypothetical protein
VDTKEGTMELRVKDLWDVSFGIGFQAAVPYRIAMYIEPYATYLD